MPVITVLWLLEAPILRFETPGMTRRALSHYQDIIVLVGFIATVLNPRNPVSEVLCMDKIDRRSKKRGNSGHFPTNPTILITKMKIKKST